MSSKVGTNVIRSSQSPEVIVAFEPQKLAAPFFLRCGALIIDYIIFLLVPVAFLLFSRYLGNDGPKLVGGSLNDTGWLVSLLIAGTNLLVFPIFNGQSIGKMLTGLRIVTNDGRQPGIMRVVLRQTVGYGLTFASLGLGFLFSAFSTKGRTLHDYLCGTVVVYGDRQYR